MSKQLISVIIPVHNSEKYLSECITSVLNQSFKSFELILVDDGSTDNSYSICKQFKKKDKRVKLFSSNEPHSGAGATRNVGLNKATGDYIAFIDSDDIVSNKYLEVLLNIAKNEVDLSTVTYTNFKKDISFQDNKETLIKDLSPANAIRALFAGKLPAGPVCKLYKRSLINDLRFEKYSVAEDLLFNYYYLKKCKKISTCQYALYGYRRNQDSLTNAPFSPSRMDGLLALKKIAKVENYSKASIIRLFMEAYFIMESICYHKQEAEYPDQFTECIRIIKKYRRFVFCTRLSTVKQKIISFLSFLSPTLPAKIINKIRN